VTTLSLVEHASHVTMSASKLLSRILRPKLSSSSEECDKQQRMHDHTYGITSDPLTQFACMFSALIHDAEHDGVPNAQLVIEETPLALRYKNQSVAEQNSVDVGWNLLMEPRFQDLRNAIYNSEAEMIHFRKLVVNCVMATGTLEFVGCESTSTSTQLGCYMWLLVWKILCLTHDQLNFADLGPRYL
jgi:3'5'-cyclic nucleotide phosphodiesterase